MSHQQHTRREIIGTNDEWSTADSDHPCGLLIDGSMFPPFPSNSRDPRFWGDQDPLEWVDGKFFSPHGPHLLLTSEAGGPYDEDDGDQSWRRLGRFLYTGDTVLHSVKPRKEVEEQLTNFWRTRDAQQAGAQQAGTHQGHNPPQDTPDSGEAQFPDAPPRPSRDGLVFLLPTPNTQTTQPDSRASSSQPQGAKRKRPQGKQGVPGPASQNAAGSASAPQAQAPPRTASFTKRNTVQRSASTASKTARAGPPLDAAQWDDESLFTLWRHKVTRRKGYESMLPDFPGHTAESLAAVWRARRERCEELGFQWRIADKPEGRVEEWLEE